VTEATGARPTGPGPTPEAPALDRSMVPLVAPETYGEGVFRRRIRLVGKGPKEVVGELEDDFHHFRVRLHHDGERVTEAVGESPRAPWVTCIEGNLRIAEIHGMALSPDATAIGKVADARLHCTHTFDLAGMCVAHAWRQVHGGAPVRQYDCEVPDRFGDGRPGVQLRMDGQPLLAWRMDGTTITAPEPFAGVSLGAGFLRFCRDHLDADRAEAAVALRRAVYISAGRTQQHDWFATAGEVKGALEGTCHTYQPEIVGVSFRRKGTQLDFTDHPDVLLEGGETCGA
jgi:hypothetical protein